MALLSIASAVHPHVCGAYMYFTWKIQAFIGSSPRMWGLLINPHVKPITKRFIPTYVGLTSKISLLECNISVHPHVCGAYARHHRSRFPPNGSSPRMWGLLAFFVSLTPHPPVHPHVCGAYCNIYIAYPEIVGSSPRMWGLPLSRKRVCSSYRFIPTYVGLTHPPMISRSL